MKIVINHIFDGPTGAKLGEIFYDTTDPRMPIHHLTGQPAASWHSWLADLSGPANLQYRVAIGLEEATILAGETVAKTLWQRVCEHANSEQAEPELKALGLTS